MVRAKFYVSQVTYYGQQGKKANNGGEVQLRPVYSNEPNHENKSFWDATPSGLLTMSIKSDAIAQFELGQEYYIDFTPASETVEA
jgi:hypothetical protein